MSSFTQFSAEMSVQYDKKASQALGADHWRVTDGFRFYIGDENSGDWVNVPAGYLTDGASVPRLFWNVIPPWGAYGQAAVVHDIICEYLSITRHGQPFSVTRTACDDILMQAMEALEVPWLTRQAIHKAVSLFRLVSGVNSPTNTHLKRSLESQWSL
jgi:hypothetical protein